MFIHINEINIQHYGHHALGTYYLKYQSASYQLKIYANKSGGIIKAEHTINAAWMCLCCCKAVILKNVSMLLCFYAFKMNIKQVNVSSFLVACASWWRVACKQDVVDVKGGRVILTLLQTKWKQYTKHKAKTQERKKERKDYR